MMHSSLRSFLLLAFSAGLLSLASCGENRPPTATATAEAPATAAAPDTTKSAATPATAARYECPMGCEGSQSSQPGKCPVCEMELELKKS